MNKCLISLLVIFAAFSSSSAAAGIGFRTSEDDVLTLYRSSVVNGGKTWRVHVATFDAGDGKAYNLDNCQTAKALFQNQPGVKVRYWCENGYFRK